MKTKTNEEIFENVRENGYISEREINLLKNRSNNERRDVFNYDLIEDVADGYGVPVKPEQGAKGLAWLKKLLKKDGTPRYNSGLGYREADIIKSATPDDFLFLGLHDVGNRFLSNFVPLYSVGGMDYYCDGGRAVVVG